MYRVVPQTKSGNYEANSCFRWLNIGSGKGEGGGGASTVQNSVMFGKWRTGFKRFHSYCQSSLLHSIEGCPV